MTDDASRQALQAHAQWGGKLATAPKMALDSPEALATAYTPGVAAPCLAIADDPQAVYDYTIKANTVAVVTDGSAVLGLGNIGPAAALPVMEGKCALFKAFGDVNAVPICLDTQDADEIVRAVVQLAPAFGGINLEDIAAPRCFEIERRCNEALDIPVFHDDQHGTAIVVLAAVINALRLTGRHAETARVVVNGAGSAGVAITRLFVRHGFSDIVLCDSAGIVGAQSPRLNDAKRQLLPSLNPRGLAGGLGDALDGADVFVGVSAAGALSPQMVSSMAPEAIVFALANPVPEIYPDQAKEAGARVVGTGRSDFANQINNVLVFPGIFKGVLQARAASITEPMKLAAASALAHLVGDDLAPDYVIPDAFDPRCAQAVAQAVMSCA